MELAKVVSSFFYAQKVVRKLLDYWYFRDKRKSRSINDRNFFFENVY